MSTAVCRVSHHLVLLYFIFIISSTTTETYTLSLHDALPILSAKLSGAVYFDTNENGVFDTGETGIENAVLVDRKSTRLNSSHTVISYAVFCLKKKKLTYISIELALCRTN